MGFKVNQIVPLLTGKREQERAKVYYMSDSMVAIILYHITHLQNEMCKGYTKREGFGVPVQFFELRKCVSLNNNKKRA